MATQTGLDRFIGRADSGGAPAPSEPASTTAETGKDASAVPAQAEAKTEGEATKPVAAVEAEPEDFDQNDPAEKTPHQRTGLRKALGAEKRKRQELERQLDELRTRPLAPQAAQPQEQAKSDPNSDFFGDPTKHIDTVAEAKAKAAAATVSKQLFQMSRRQMMQQHQDFEQAETAFLEAAKADPTLFARMNAATTSGAMLETEFAYETGKQLLELESLGASSLTELKTAIEKRVREEYEAQHRKNGALAAAEKASTSSAGARGSGQTSPIVADDSEEPIGKILKRR